MRTLDDQALKTLVADFIEFLRFNRNASEHTALAYAGDLTQFIDYVASSQKRARPTLTAADLTTDGIRTFLAGGAKLVSSDAYQRAADAVDMGERTRGFGYVDVDGLVPLVEQFGGTVPPEANDAVSAIDSFILEASGDGDVTTARGFVRLND